MAVEPRAFSTCYTSGGLHKRTYASKNEAKLAARQSRSRVGTNLTAYKGDCGYWHVGSSQGYERTLEVNVSRATADWVGTEASRWGISMSEFVRTALDHYANCDQGA